MNEPLWYLTKDGDATCLALYERHYSCHRYRDRRKRILFVGPGEKIVLRTGGGATLCLFGENSSTAAASKASIVPSSETRDRSGRPNLFAKRMRSLIISGLVKGITHTSIRKQLGAEIRDSALWPLDGGAAE